MRSVVHAREEWQFTWSTTLPEGRLFLRITSDKQKILSEKIPHLRNWLLGIYEIGWLVLLLARLSCVHAASITPSTRTGSEWTATTIGTCQSGAWSSQRNDQAAPR